MLLKQSFKYFVESLQVVFPNDATALTVDPVMVRGLVLENEYDDSFFPIFRIDLSLKREVAQRVVKEKDGVRFKLVVRKREYNQEKVVRTRPFLSDTFIIFLDEDTPFFDESEVSGNRSNGGDSPGLADTALSFYLFKETDLLSSKKIINAVLHDVQMPDIVGYLLSSLKTIRRVLFATPDNKDKIEEVLLPPQTIIGNMLYVSNRYGLYKNGMTMFFDFSRTYIIPRQAKCVVWEPGEAKEMEIQISQPRDEQTVTTGHKYNTETELTSTNVPYDAVSITSPTLIQDQLEGNHRLFINPRYNTRVSQKHDLKQRGSGSYKLVRVKYPSNPYIMTAEAQRLRTGARIVTVTTKDVDVSLFTPNKQFLLKFAQTKVNKEYGGMYRLASCKTVFSGNGEDMAAVTVLRFQP